MTPELQNKRDEMARVYGIYICNSDAKFTGDPVNIAYDFKFGFDACYDLMSKTHVPRDVAELLAHRIEILIRIKEASGSDKEALRSYRAATKESE